MIEPRKQITGKDRDRLTKTVQARYLKGASIRTLANEHNRSYGFIHRLLVESDVALRARGSIRGG